MSTLTLAVWNMEWMNDLFGPNDEPPAFRPDDHPPQHHKSTTVRQRRDDLSGVLDELSADIVVVVEGPNRTAELALFFDEDVAGDWVVEVQPSKGQSQCVGIAVRTDLGKFLDPPFSYHDTNNITAFDPFLVDTDGDEIDEQHKYERRPLFVEVRPLDGTSFHIMGLHLKSKAIFGSYEWSKWWQIADANRRKILAQVTQLRLEFLDPFLSADETKDSPLIVCGDINDGPGLDASEKRMFGSAVERLMGTVWKPDLALRNALFDALDAKHQAALDFSGIQTSSFRDPIFNYTWHRVWLDHVLYNDIFDDPWVRDAEVRTVMDGGSRIWEKYKHASDHHPITVTVET